jgi:DNA polymerase I-like protein with 3'-5' exonuclease and polymerase domains
VAHTIKRPDRPGNWTYFDGLWLANPVSEGLERLQKEIDLVKPSLIIPLGNLALWAVTRKWGIMDWRGSQIIQSSCTVVPAYHPAAVLRQWSWRFITVHDLKRAKRSLAGVTFPDYQFTARPTFGQVIDRLEALRADCDKGPTTLAVDIETRWGHIACLGIGWSRLEAICIPFMCSERREGYWSLEEEAAILPALARLLQHPNARVVGQNFLYDVQYIHRHFHFLPRFFSDTMLSHHVCFPGLPKALDFLSSLYCDYHLYWKADGKEWHKTMQEDILWTYNCKDCVITFECNEALQSTVSKLGLEGPYEQQMALWTCALKTMLRGIRVDYITRAKVKEEISAEILKLTNEMTFILGHPINPRSTTQMQALFYGDLQQKPYHKRRSDGGYTVTCDDDALEKMVKREPLLSPVIERIQALRSLGVFLSTFVEARPDELDGRMRSFFNPAGTETFRFSSSQDAFGSGMNLENIPKGDDE